MLRAFPPFTGPELSKVSGTILPVVMSTQPGELNRLNLMLEKFLTVGSDIFFIGMKQRDEAQPLDFIAWNLLRAGLIDHSRGIEQFSDGLELAERLSGLDFWAGTSTALKEAGMSDRSASVIESMRPRQRELEYSLKFLIEKARSVYGLHGQALRMREALMVPKKLLALEEIIPEPPADKAPVAFSANLDELIAHSRRIEMQDLISHIAESGIRIIRLDGPTARGKSTFVEALARAIGDGGKKVGLIDLDAIALRHHDLRAPVKAEISEAIGRGFISSRDRELSFDMDRMGNSIKELIVKLNSGRPSTMTLSKLIRTWKKGGGETVRSYEAIKEELPIDEDHVYIVVGKYQCDESFWAGNRLPMLTLLMHAKEEEALARHVKRASPGLAREQENLFRYWLEPSFDVYAEEVRLIEKADVVVDTTENALKIFKRGGLG